MASTAGVSAPICERRTVSGNQPKMRRLPEGTTQTFKIGVPLMLSSGNLIVWDGSTITSGIAGISKENGASLSSAGVAKQATFPGSVPYESSAQLISRPYFNDGKTEVAVANLDTEFYGQVGAASLSGVTIGSLYGMTVDTDGHWYVDTSKTTSSGGGRNTVLEIVGFDDWDTTRGVIFKFQSDVVAGL